MADLRKDLTDSIIQKKYYDEIELGRLSNDPNMNYWQKIEEMNEMLERIAISNMKLGLMDFYFGQQQQTTTPVQPQGTHPGQTHGE